MRLAFLGSPPAAAVVLRSLHAAGHDIRLVVTRPDKRRGRGSPAGPTAVKAAALELGLPVTSDITGVGGAGAELGVVVAYGRLIKPDILSALPMVNVHFSLLPRWRGAAPVARAILAGDPVTGVCLMQVDEGLDTGGVYRRREVAVDPEESAAGLTARLAVLGADMVVTALGEGLGRPSPQEGEPTYAAKIGPDELHLDWSAPAERLQRIVRVGRAWTTWRAGRLIVVAARPVAGSGPAGSIEGDVVWTGDGGLRLLEVQPEGRRVQAASDWLRGARIQAGEKLGT